MAVVVQAMRVEFFGEEGSRQGARLTILLGKIVRAMA